MIQQSQVSKFLAQRVADSQISFTITLGSMPCLKQFATVSGGATLWQSSANALPAMLCQLH